MRDEQDRLAGLLELLDLGQALAGERLVADGQHLVDQQHVRVDVDGDGERELDVLAGGVVLDRVVDAGALLGEVDDRLVQAVELAAGQARAARR